MNSYDVIFVLPYPFSDHPSFPEAVLKRTLEHEGFHVGVLEAPFWQEKGAFSALGRPNLFFAIIPGPVDSMVLNYTSSHKRRREDLYQLEGRAFFEDCPPSIHYKVRPDRAVVVFSNRLKEAFRDVPIVIGGLESSLRCFAHYDFQQGRIRRSVLIDSRADVLVTGMGEKQLVRIARLLKSGGSLEEVDLPGTARIWKDPPEGGNFVILPSLDDILREREGLLEAQKILEKARLHGQGLIQQQNDRYVVEMGPERYTRSDLDRIYAEPYTRMHLKTGSYSPALRMNLTSVTSHRGCSGGCSFCSISIHQGKRIISRSIESITNEIVRLTQHRAWKGYISDIGGATAEMYDCDCGVEDCPRPSCLHPFVCPEFGAGRRYLELLRVCRKIKGMKKVFLGSGIRHDVLLTQPELLEEIMVHHCGRFLRVAPEHTENPILDLMRKPPYDVLETFVHLFRSINRGLKRKIELAPYLIIGHPGEKAGHVLEMKKKLKSLGLRASHTQIFTPTPGTLSTALYYAGCNPSGEIIPVERKIRELIQRKEELIGK